MSRTCVQILSAMVVLFSMVSFSTRVLAEDCNGNSIDDAQDIALGTSTDCDEDNVPDECNVVGVDIVFILDASGSMDGQEQNVCDEAAALSTQLAARGVTDRAFTILQINDGDPLINYPCASGNVVDNVSGSVPQAFPHNSCGPLTHSANDEESWAPATSKVAHNFPWRAGRLRVIVVITNDAGCHGGGTCDSADFSAVANAAAVTFARDVMSFGILAPGSPACVTTLLNNLSNQNYQPFVLGGASTPLAALLTEWVRLQTSDCNDNGVLDLCDRADFNVADCNANLYLDECELSAGTADDCNLNDVLDECDIALATSVDCDANGVPDECEPAGVVFVDASAGGANTGVTWDDAFTELSDALAGAATCRVSEIWVAAGVYVPGESEIDTFALRSGIAVYGGFAGGEATRDERDTSANPTVLSGDLGGSQFALHVVTAGSDVDTTGVLDGFTITGGYAAAFSGDFAHGGGLFVDIGASPTIRNCKFEGNQATASGGAAFLRGPATLENCQFIANDADKGGAVAIASADAKLTGCTFADNLAYDFNGTSGGGAIYMTNAAPSVSRCSFVGNTSTSSGGGVCMLISTPTISDSFFGSNGALGEFGGGGGIGIFDGSAPVIYNCVFSDNIAGYGGGVDLYSGSTATIVNCSFFANKTWQFRGGGGLDNSNSLGTNVVNSIFWANTDQFSTPNQITLFEASTQTSLRISYSNVEGGENEIYHPCQGCTLVYMPTNINADPKFIDSLGPDGRDGTLDDNLRLQVLSPSVDAGSNGAVATIDTDADGYDRVVFGVVDMGAYEVFVDCNENSLPDALDLMDHDENGVVDLLDFQYFQLCFESTGATCLAAFDRAPDCGVIDLNDFLVFEEQITGPSSTMMMAMDSFGGMEMLSGSESGEGADEIPYIETSTLGFEIQPLGGGAALTVLAPHTAYELHYTAKADFVSWYLLITAAASAAEGLGSVEPPVTGPWADTDAFVFEDVLETYDELIDAPDHPDLYWTDSATSTQYLSSESKESAPASGMLCIIETGDVGEFTLGLYMFQLSDSEEQSVVILEAAATFVIQMP